MDSLQMKRENLVNVEGYGMKKLRNHPLDILTLFPHEFGPNPQSMHVYILKIKVGKHLTFYFKPTFECPFK